MSSYKGLFSRSGQALAPSLALQGCGGRFLERRCWQGRPEGSEQRAYFSLRVLELRDLDGSGGDGDDGFDLEVIIETFTEFYDHIAYMLRVGFLWPI